MQRALMMITLLALPASFTALAQDPVKVAEKQCKVTLENDHLRVLHWTVGAHEKTAMHGHPALVSIALAPAKTSFTGGDGKTRQVESKAGQVTWSDPEKHASENLGETAGDIIQVELKQKPAAAMTMLPASEDSVKVDPKHYKVEIENDRVRVLRVKYAPGEKSVMHGHPASLAVFLTDGQGKMTLPDGKSETLPFKRGQAMWSEKQTHLPENTGGAPLELILIELK